MILGLMRRRKAPTSKRLLPLYQRARVLVQKLHITEWIHHYRDRNKMADKAANVAMDSRSSFQSPAFADRPELSLIIPWLQNDIQPWLDRHLSPGDSNPDPVR